MMLRAKKGHWSKSSHKTAHVTKSPSHTVTTAKQGAGVPDVLHTNNKWEKSIPDNAFRTSTGGKIVTSSGMEFEELTLLSKGGSNKKALSSINSPLAKDGSAVKVLDNTSKASFAEPQILEKNISNTKVEKNAAKQGSNVDSINNNARTPDKIQEAFENDPALKKANKTLGDKIWQGMKIVTLSGFVILGGGYLWSNFDKAIDANSGCFVVERTTKGNVWYRILGYSCGSAGARGDALWLEQGLPTKTHPFQNCMGQRAICEGMSTTCDSCNTNDILEYEDCDIEDLPDNQTLICRKVGIFDVLGDVAENVGVDAGNIFGGAIGGVFSGMFGGAGIFTWLIAILASAGTFIVAINTVAGPWKLLIALGAAIAVFLIVLLIMGTGKGKTKLAYANAIRAGDNKYQWPMLPFQHTMIHANNDLPDPPTFYGFESFDHPELVRIMQREQYLAELDAMAEDSSSSYLSNDDISKVREFTVIDEIGQPDEMTSSPEDFFSSDENYNSSLQQPLIPIPVIQSQKLGKRKPARVEPYKITNRKLSYSNNTPTPIETQKNINIPTVFEPLTYVSPTLPQPPQVPSPIISPIQPPPKPSPIIAEKSVETNGQPPQLARALQNTYTEINNNPSVEDMPVVPVVPVHPPVVKEVVNGLESDSEMNFLNIINDLTSIISSDTSDEEDMDIDMDDFMNVLSNKYKPESDEVHEIQQQQHATPSLNPPDSRDEGDNALQTIRIYRKEESEIAAGYIEESEPNGVNQGSVDQPTQSPELVDLEGKNEVPLDLSQETISNGHVL